MTAKTLILCLVATVGGLVLAACQPLDEAAVEATLTVSEAPYLDAIPADYGDLVAVTSDRPYVAVLWFERADHTVTAVRVQYARAALAPTVIEIPRR